MIIWINAQCFLCSEIWFSYLSMLVSRYSYGKMIELGVGFIQRIHVYASLYDDILLFHMFLRYLAFSFYIMPFIETITVNIWLTFTWYTSILSIYNSLNISIRLILMQTIYPCYYWYPCIYILYIFSLKIIYR